MTGMEMFLAILVLVVIAGGGVRVNTGDITIGKDNRSRKD